MFHGYSFLTEILRIGNWHQHLHVDVNHKKFNYVIRLTLMIFVRRYNIHLKKSACYYTSHLLKHAAY